MITYVIKQVEIDLLDIYLINYHIDTLPVLYFTGDLVKKLAVCQSDWTSCTSNYFFLQLRNGWACRVVRTVVPHTKSANTACKTLLKMDRWGPKHVELTYVMSKLNH